MSSRPSPEMSLVDAIDAAAGFLDPARRGEYLARSRNRSTVLIANFNTATSWNRIEDDRFVGRHRRARAKWRNRPSWRRLVVVGRDEEHRHRRRHRRASFVRCERLVRGVRTGAGDYRHATARLASITCSGRHPDVRRGSSGRRFAGCADGHQVRLMPRLESGMRPTELFQIRHSR